MYERDQSGKKLEKTCDKIAGRIAAQRGDGGLELDQATLRWKPDLLITASPKWNESNDDLVFRKVDKDLLECRLRDEILLDIEHGFGPFHGAE